jgi:NADH dehydrogenase
MNIIIFGATGFLGWNVLPLLLKDERVEKILAVTHSTRLNTAAGAEKLFTVSQDEFFSSCFDSKGLLGAVVICLAGDYSSTSDDSALREANFETPKKIIDSLGKDIMRHFILASSINTRFAGYGGYAQYKREIETYLVSSGIPYTIFRPALIIGKSGAGLSKIIDYVKKLPVIPVFGDGKKLEQPIHITEAAEFFYQAALSAPANQIIEIGGLNAMTYNDMLFTIAGAFNRSIKLLHLPARPFYLLLSFLEHLGLRLLVSSEQVLHIDTDLNIDNAPALSRYCVGLRPFREWLREYV